MKVPSAEGLKVIFSRGKITFGLSTPTREMTWVLSSTTPSEQVLDVLEDILSVLRPQQCSVSTVDQIDTEIDRLGALVQDSNTRVNDGIAFQPPKHIVLGGTVDLGHIEPSAQ